AFEVAEDAAGNAAEHGDRRIVGMNADEHALFLSHRYYLPNEVLIVVPDFLFRVDAAVRELAFELLARPVAGGIVQLEGARAGVAAGGFGRGTPDAVAHVRIGGVMETGAAQVAKEILVVFDLPVAAGKIKGHLVHVVDVAVADVPDAE